MSQPKFQDRVVLITGAGRGVGRAAAAAFARQGAILALNDLTPVNLDETVAQVEAVGGRVRTYLEDMAKKMPIQGMLEQILADWGRIDILINNAAVCPKQTILTMDEWDFVRTLEVNLAGPFFLMQSVGRIMREQGGGVMINLADEAALATELSSLPAAYLASKSGLVGLSRAAANEFAPYNIDVHWLCPGPEDPETVAQWILSQSVPTHPASPSPGSNDG